MLEVRDLELLARIAEVDDVPVERDDATAATSSSGNCRSARMFSISRPTFPVAPTTATR